MTSSYTSIFNRFLGKVTDYSFLNLSDEEIYEMELEWLKATLGRPNVRKLFSTLCLFDETQQMIYELKFPIDDFSDEQFVKELLATGMTIEWLSPIVDDVINKAIMLGGKEEKVMINNHKSNIQRLENLELKLNKLIRDHGVLYNTYMLEEE